MDSSNLQKLHQLIEDNLPDNDFICVVGTSHTYGECVRDGSDRLNIDDLWTSHIENETGIEVINFGRRGLTNNDMVHLIGFLSKSQKVKNLCKMIIIECRFLEPSMPWDFRKYTLMKHATGGNKHFYDILMDRDGKINSPPWWDSRFTQSITDIDFDNFVSRRERRFPLPPGWVPNLKENIKELVIGNIMSHNNELPKKIPFISDIALFEELVDFFVTYNNMCKNSLSHIFQDCNYIQSMIDIVELMEIPVKWFCWDTYTQEPYFASEELLDDSRLHKMREMISETHSIFDYEFNSFLGGAKYQYIMEFGDYPEECDCGHQQEPYHKWIADKTIKEIKENLQ